jgi:putative addiction module killer protein
MREAIPRTVESYVTPSGEDIFHAWLDGLTDLRTRVLIDKAVAKVRLGNLGDHKSVGDGVQEIRLDHGPGYRLYFAEQGKTLVLLLCGGTKRRQQEDIARAKQFWKDWKERTSR